MPRSKHSHCRRLIFSIVFSLLCCWASPLGAQTDPAKAIENLAAEIRLNKAAVAQTLMEAMNTNHGDLQKWSALDEKMAELGRSIDGNLPEIGRNAAILFDLDPNVTLPSVALGQTFEGNLRMATGKKNQLLELAKAENIKLDKINQMLARVNRDIGNAARELIGATMEGFLPDEISLAGEGTVIVLGAYFGPPGILAAGLAWAATGTFNSMVNLYNNSRTAADQAKVLGEMKQGLQIRKTELEKNIAVLMDGAREMQQIEQILDRHEKRMSEFKGKISAALDGWNNQSKAAFEARKKKLEEESQKMAAQPKPELKPYGWAYGMDPVPPISPGDYGGEVDAMISQMRSYAQAVEDGGDPDNFQAMVTDWHNRLNDRYKKIKEDYDQKVGLYNQASNNCWKTISAALAEANHAYTSLWNSCRPWDDRCRAAAAAIGARYSAAEKAAYEALRPFGQALISPYREVLRLNQISYRVSEAYYPFRARVENATRARTREFWNAYGLWQDKFNEANIKVRGTVDAVPWVDHWKDRGSKIDEEIQWSLRWGGNIVDIRAGLLATAEHLKELDKTVRAAAKDYAEANGTRMLLSNQAQSELTSILNRYGRLLYYNWSSGYYMPWLGSPMEFIPRTREQEQNIAYLSTLIRNTFAISEPENLKRAQATDILGIAATYKNKADELAFHTDWVDTYRHRLATAAGALNRISLEKTDRGLFADRGGSAWEVLAREFSKPPWSTITQEADQFVSPKDYSALPQARFQSWESLGLWQKLYAGQNLLLARLEKEARYYIQSRSQGGFQPVNAAIMKPLEDDWKKLRQLCDRYDALAKPEREKIGDGLEQAQKAVQIVFETWGKMSALSRNIVQSEHSRFQSAYQWVDTYLRIKTEALKPSLQPPTNALALQLDDLILGYAARFEKYRKDLEEAQRQMEEWQRRYEAEQKLLREEEQKKAEAERQRIENEQKKAQENMALVKDLYARFKSAYEGKNDSQVMSMISDGWQAGDGSSLSDLQVNIRRTFRTFDEIRYNIQNLIITPGPGGRYSVSYDVAITSRIYKRNLKHEEKSSINEEVIIDSAGKAKISRTLGGRFWYIQ